MSFSQLCAVHPKIYSARTLETRNCNQGYVSCPVVSSSSYPIDTGDLSLDRAHNYAIATYDYFYNTFGRDSIDDAGMKLASRVHYGVNYGKFLKAITSALINNTRLTLSVLKSANAFWDGSQMTYGDGDGVVRHSFSQDADVVAHELMHGITEHTSGLIYQGESGALNEAWSDIFGAMVDKETGATGDSIWHIGEDIFVNPGNLLRNMQDPTATGGYVSFC